MLKSSLLNKVGLVTGASRGIGRGIALAFAEQGAHVVLAARSTGQLEQVAKEIQALGGRAHVVKTDLFDNDAVRGMVKEAASEFGRLDILVNNAGGAGIYVRGGGRGFLDTKLDAWQGIYQLNLTAPFIAAQEAAQMMATNGGGSIINITSGVALYGIPEAQAYSGAKAALHHLTPVWAAELGRYGIRVNEIVPGGVETANMAGLISTPQDRAAVEARIPLGRIGQPSDIAAAAVFLGSDEAAWISGATLAVNGGARAGGPVGPWRTNAAAERQLRREDRAS